MNCGCVKNIGCFVPGQTIDFGFVAPCDDKYIFEIFSVSGFSTIEVDLLTGDPLELPFTFNENAETIIKIRVPDCAKVPGFNYFTTTDGACSFAVNGMISSACPTT
jgi:hypothetical protein